MGDRDRLTTEEAQQYLGVSRAIFLALTKCHKIPTYKIPVRGKRSFFRRDDLYKLREPIPRDGIEKAQTADVRA